MMPGIPSEKPKVGKITSVLSVICVIAHLETVTNTDRGTQFAESKQPILHSYLGQILSSSSAFYM